MTTLFSSHSQFKERRSLIQQRTNQRPLSRLEAVHLLTLNTAVA